MSPCLQLGVNGPVVDADLETPTIGRHQNKRVDLHLEFFQQLGRQTDGTIGIMSNGTVNQLYFHGIL
jgi:hypothetical protein